MLYRFCRSDRCFRFLHIEVSTIDRTHALASRRFGSIDYSYTTLFYIYFVSTSCNWLSLLLNAEINSLPASNWNKNKNYLLFAKLNKLPSIRDEFCFGSLLQATFPGNGYPIWNYQLVVLHFVSEFWLAPPINGFHCNFNSSLLEISQTIQFLFKVFRFDLYFLSSILRRHLTIVVLVVLKKKKIKYLLLIYNRIILKFIVVHWLQKLCLVSSV